MGQHVKSVLGLIVSAMVIVSAMLSLSTWPWLQ